MPLISDDARLRDLNEQYVRASLAGDVEWYRERLDPRFVCIDSDGEVLDKDAFLRQTAGGSTMAHYRLAQVDVCRYGRDGEVALVRATGEWTTKDGTPGVSRYVDVYVRDGDDWKVVSAQITRPQVAAAQA